MATATPDTSFQACFGPLARHLFPDGCPVVASDEGTSATPEEAVHLQRVWPASSRRNAVSFAAAIRSISDLKVHAVAHGLTPPEMVAVAFAASATLPTGPSKVHSPMQDGAAGHFCSLVRSLLPQNSNDRSAAEKQSQEVALVVAARRLVSSACCRFGNVQEEHSKARRSVLRFLTLSMLWLEPIQWPQACVSSVFQWALQSSTCVDAIRVLWYTNTMLPTYRLNQLQAFSAHLEQQPVHFTTARAAVAHFLELYRDKRMKISRDRKGDWLTFPDEAWKQDFMDEKRSGVDVSANNSIGRKAELADLRRAKRSRRSSRNLQRLAAHIQKMVGATADDDNVMFEVLSSWATTSTVSDILEDESIQHLTSLSRIATRLPSSSVSNGDVSTEDESWVLRRFRNILVYKLYEQWYELPGPTDGKVGDADGDSATRRSGDHDARVSDEVSRLRILNALAEFAHCAGGLPVEAEAFILQDILPVWDGDSDSKFGRALLNVLPYAQPPLAGKSCRSFAQLIAHGGGQGEGVGQLFYNLERLFLYGDDRLKYAIVSGTLAALVYRWGLLDWSTSSVADPGIALQGVAETTEWKVQLLRELCQWTDDLLLRGFLATDDSSELLRAAAVDFYSAICDLTDNKSTATVMVLAVTAAPSPSIMYRLLLSSSAVHVNRVCLLMVRYKRIFQKWKEQQALEVDGDSSATSDSSSGMKRIRVYNCFVWDFCSVLWRCSPPPPPQNVTDGMDEGEGARAFSILYTDLRPATQQCLYEASSTPTKSESQNFSLASALSITHGAAFSDYVLDFLQSLRDAQPVAIDQTYNSPDQIRGKIKLQYLDYLKSRGLHGIHEFLSTFLALWPPEGQQDRHTLKFNTDRRFR